MLNDGTMEGSSIFVFLIFFFFVSLFREGGKLVDEDGLDHVEFRNRVLFLFFKENGKFLESWLDVVI